MNKPYIKPTVKAIKLKTTAILQTSPIPVDTSTGTDTQYSKESSCFGETYSDFEE